MSEEDPVSLDEVLRAADIAVEEAAGVPKSLARGGLGRMAYLVVQEGIRSTEEGTFEDVWARHWPKLNPETQTFISMVGAILSAQHGPQPKMPWRARRALKRLQHWVEQEDWQAINVAVAAESEENRSLLAGVAIDKCIRALLDRLSLNEIEQAPEA